jgi:2-(1,2-epoxy-1,2-dihydrophenyl)acetyl-CoA isomerase
MADGVRFHVEDGLAWITLDRPAARNAIDDAMREALVAAVAQIGRDETIRAAVLTAAGDMFCPGADLLSGRQSRSAAPHPGQVRALMRQNSQRLIRTLLEVEKPIIAAVNGTAAGLGAHLALACDLVIMAAEARLIEVFARRGLAVDAAGAYLLSRIVPIHKAKELVFFADDVPAAEALRLGLCNRVVPRAELESVAREWGARLASGPTFALGMSKSLLEQAYRSDLETCLEAERMAQALVAQSEDMQEGVRSFVERRPPRFKGR